MAKKNERRDRFEKVAARRVQNIIDYLDTLSNCANTNNYEYSQEDVRKMFKAIKDQVSITESAFTKQMSKDGKNSFKF